MSDRICIFAGTTEGRKLAELLRNAAEVTVCTATEYGEVMLDGTGGLSNGTGGLTVRSGRMDADEMTDFFKENKFDRIIDATHPYAVIATDNIASAASRTGIPYLRILRENDRVVKDAVHVSSVAGSAHLCSVSDAVHVSSVAEAGNYLSGRSGNILITTGAKEISEYAGLDMSRVWARVLPVASSLEACEKAGIPTSHIIAAQGPFTKEMNLAQLRMINAAYIVTKASGKNGGFEEKINAALDCGVIPVIIGRPPQKNGMLFEEAVRELEKTYRLSDREITLVGIGPGDEGMLTMEARKALESCDAVFGATSVINSLNLHKPCYSEYAPENIKNLLKSHPSIRNAVIVFRGDTGFFSGAANFLKIFEDQNDKSPASSMAAGNAEGELIAGAAGNTEGELIAGAAGNAEGELTAAAAGNITGDTLYNVHITVLPGISSTAAFAAKLKVSRNDAAQVSLHGRNMNFISAVCRNKKIFMLTGGENTPAVIFEKMKEYGLGHLHGAVGERLSFPDERITKGSVSSLCEREYDPLSVIYIENPAAVEEINLGIDDDRFVRGNVPMTKSEIRAVSISGLSLQADSIVWDIGAGTGSVSVECALAAYRGQVYAIEKNSDAAELIKQNRLRFKADNIHIVSGTAPDALDKLPAPTHAFIGGSGGRLRGILEMLLKKNPEVRIVMNTVTLESQAEAFACAKEYGFDCFDTFEAITLNVSRTKKAGAYHLMSANNPVTIFVMQKRADR